MIFYEEGLFRIESVPREVLKKQVRSMVSDVFEGYSSFSSEGLNPSTEKVDRLRENLKELYTLNLGLFEKEKLIGWSFGSQTFANDYYMESSGVLFEYRRRGLYSKMLDFVLKETKKEGFLEVSSHHHAENNRILMAKMKRDFFISGFQVLPKYGLTVRMTYCHNPELKAMYEYRSGRVLQPSIQGRLQSSW